MYVCESEIWRNLIWRLQRQTAEPPNLIPRQIFRLYGIITSRGVCFARPPLHPIRLSSVRTYLHT